MSSHLELTALIPWYVNHTLDETQRMRLEDHIAECAACRRDLELERAVHLHMTADPGVEYMPAASLKKLQARLDALQSPSASEPAEPAPPAPPAFKPWRYVAAAAVVAGAVVLGVLAFEKHPQSAAQTYYTVTTPAPRVQDEVIRAVFAPSITLTDLQALLEESQLRIIAGPTEAGVYSLASNSSRPVAASLRMLREHDSVRFAESTQPAVAAPAAAPGAAAPGAVAPGAAAPR